MNRKSIINLAICGIIAGYSTANASIEEVIVTAQHRAQNLQDVPVSVSAFGGEQMKEADIRGATEIALYAPGMAYAEFAPGQSLISMRGIISADDGAGMDNSVTAFLDGVYIGRPANINFDLYDLERVEILRGPQGTLFGRNAIGGAINIVTSKPTEELTGNIDVGFGNEGIITYEGLVSGPLSDNVLGKISYSHRERDGFVDNIVLNKDQADEDKDSARAQLQFTPTDNSKYMFSIDWMEDQREDMGRTPIFGASVPAAMAAGVGRDNPFRSAAPTDGFSNREAIGASLTADWDFETGTLTSISAWRNSETDWEMASIGVAFGGGGIEVIDDIIEEIDQFSQELRWTSQLEGNINFVAGLYFLQEETDRLEQFKLWASAPSDVIGNEASRQENETTSFAAYGQLDWDFTEDLTLTLGLRFTQDEKEVTSTTVNCGMPGALASVAECEGVGGSLSILPTTFQVTVDETWDDVSPKVALNYRINDGVMLYGSVAKGFKSGGFGGAPGTIEAAQIAVEPEEAMNYEVGLKGDFLDNTLRLNLTAYYTDYEDLQIVRFGPLPSDPSGFGVFLTTNIGQADISGAEAEITWAPTDNLQFTGTYAYLDTELSDLVINGVDVSGSELRQAPENSGSVAVNYTHPIESGLIKARLDYTFTDEQLGDYLQRNTIIDQFELVNARLAWQSEDEKWEVALWGKNLADEEYISHSYTIGPGVIGVWGAPRTYGLTVSWSLN